MIQLQFSTSNKDIKHAGMRMPALMITLALASVCSPFANAQDGHAHAQAQQQEKTAEQLGQENALVKVIQDATERFKDVRVAEAAGYKLTFGCVSGEDYGAMGLHYVNFDLVNGGALDATRPQIIIYEATPNGGRRLIGVDYLLLAEAWDAKKAGPPELMGQFFHLFTSPNRFGLPAFYTLHVWAWKPNPKGTFVNWHSKVSCDEFDSKKP
ncbi:MAG: hypothetical protein H7039_19825 [Bryobacteraceae bacterium]|nr:hypothetical protein [Bryobacteraceae bacterium]